MSTASSIAAPAVPIARAVRGGALDGLRFLAALFVVVFHFGDEAPVAIASLHEGLGRGYLATDFFLMLSGFVLARAYGASIVAGTVSPGRFWWKRFARCYPTHLITLGLLTTMVATAALLGVAANHPENFQWSGLPAQILLLHVFGQGGGQWNIPSWTLSALLVCYAAFPWLWRRMLRVQRPLTALGLGLLILVGADLASLALLGAEQFSLPFQWAFVRAAPLFLVGLTLARIVQTGRWSPGSARFTGFAGVALLLGNAALSGPDLINILAIAVVIVGCGAAPVTRPLPGAEWGARVSFSLFMTHTLTGAVWFGLVAPQLVRRLPTLETVAWEGWMLWLGAGVAALVVADLYNRIIDAPIQRRLNAVLFAPGVRSPFNRWSRPARYPAPEPSA
jgi:peptidoglycan/LPS O-acetylase OafA/YrhL